MLLHSAAVCPEPNGKEILFHILSLTHTMSNGCLLCASTGSSSTLYSALEGQWTIQVTYMYVAQMLGNSFQQVLKGAWSH